MRTVSLGLQMGCCWMIRLKTSRERIFIFAPAWQKYYWAFQSIFKSENFSEYESADQVASFDKKTEVKISSHYLFNKCLIASLSFFFQAPHVIKARAWLVRTWSRSVARAQFREYVCLPAQHLHVLPAHHYSTIFLVLCKKSTDFNAHCSM